MPSFEIQNAMPFRVEAERFCACEYLPATSSKRSQRQRAQNRGAYPLNWRGVSNRVKAVAGWRCECCGHPRKPRNGADACDAMCLHADDGKRRTLTTHHLDMNPENCDDSNLVALCWTCHARVQSRLDWAQFNFVDKSPSWRGDLPDFLSRRREDFLSFVESLDERQPRVSVKRNAAARSMNGASKTARVRKPRPNDVYASQSRLALF